MEAMMNISFSAPISGMKASSIRHDITDHDVANVNTPGFEEQQAHQTDVRPTGTCISHVSRTPNPDPALSNTDLAEEAKEQIVNKNAFTANAKVIRVQDEMLGTLLDILS
jgi:flagellar basal-body rod protein FlgC